MLMKRTLPHISMPTVAWVRRTLLAGLCSLGLACFSHGMAGSADGADQDAFSGTPAVMPAGLPLYSLHAGVATDAPVVPRRLFKLPITVTGYSSTPDQTDSTPFITASNKRVRRGIIALSRDLLREFTPGAPFSYGDKVELEGVGVFYVEDTMNARFTKRADIWFTSRDAALRWGKRGLTMAKLAPTGREGQHTVHSAPLFAAALAD